MDSAQGSEDRKVPGQAGAPREVFWLGQTLQSPQSGERDCACWLASHRDTVPEESGATVNPSCYPHGLPQVSPPSDTDT